MKEILITLRNCLFRISYKLIVRSALFLIDAEDIHEKTIRFCQFFGKYSILRGLTSLLFFYSNPILEQKIHGIKFSNPIGLAAGFDKNALLTDILPSLGFGFVEVGSITGEPCEGNPRPRLWRLEKSKGLSLSLLSAILNAFNFASENHFNITQSHSSFLRNFNASYLQCHITITLSSDITIG